MIFIPGSRILALVHIHITGMRLSMHKYTSGHIYMAGYLIYTVWSVYPYMARAIGQNY